MTKPLFKMIAIATAALALTACGEGEKLADDILDEIENDRQANVTVVNTLDRSVAVHIRSELFHRDVYNGDFRRMEVLNDSVSDSYKYEWVKNNETTQFAIKDANDGDRRAKTELDVEDDKDYWMVAWLKGQTRTVDVFKKQRAGEAGKYKVRIFADGVYNVLRDNVELGATVLGEVSGGYSIDNCDDLKIADNVINMCTIATAGQSYLVTYTQDGSYLVAQE